MKCILEEQFVQHIKQYERLIFTICFSFTKNYFDAENLAQETFLSAYKNIDKFAGDNLKAWLTTIAANKCRDYLKSPRRNIDNLTEEDYEYLEDSRGSPEEFEQLDDNYLFSIDKLVSVNLGIFQKRRLFAGALLFLLGIYLIWKNIMNSLWRHIPHEVYYQIQNVTRIIPQMVLGVAIVIIGIKLIMGKKRESDNNV